MLSMDCFKLMQENVDVVPLLKEIEENEAAWSIMKARQESIKAHRATETIYLRVPVPRSDMQINHNQESEWTDTSELFPLASEFLSVFALLNGGTLSRAVIVRLKPGGEVEEHIDYGAYYHVRKRYHLVLQSKNGSHMSSGGEDVIMKAGEAWWFDNSQHHFARNNSDDWRIHYIFDILPKEYAALGVNPLTPEEIQQKRETLKGA